MEAKVGQVRAHIIDGIDHDDYRQVRDNHSVHLQVSTSFGGVAASSCSAKDSHSKE